MIESCSQVQVQSVSSPRQCDDVIAQQQSIGNSTSDNVHCCDGRSSVKIADDEAVCASLSAGSSVSSSSSSLSHACNPSAHEGLDKHGVATSGGASIKSLLPPSRGTNKNTRSKQLSSSMSSSAAAVKISTMQASFAEKTAAEMEEIIRWFSLYEEKDRFVVVDQAVCLPNNAMVYNDGLEGETTAGDNDHDEDGSANTENYHRENVDDNEYYSKTEHRTKTPVSSETKKKIMSPFSPDVLEQIQASDSLIRETKYMADVISELQTNSMSLSSSPSSLSPPSPLIFYGSSTTTSTDYATVSPFHVTSVNDIVAEFGGWDDDDDYRSDMGAYNRRSCSSKHSSSSSTSTPTTRLSALPKASLAPSSKKRSSRGKEVNDPMSKTVQKPSTNGRVMTKSKIVPRPKEAMVELLGMITLGFVALCVPLLLPLSKSYVGVVQVEGQLGGNHGILDSILIENSNSQSTDVLGESMNSGSSVTLPLDDSRIQCTGQNKRDTA